MMGSGLGSRILDADFRMKDAGSKMPNLSQFRNIVETMFFVFSGKLRNHEKSLEIMNMHETC